MTAMVLEQAETDARERWKTDAADTVAALAADGGAFTVNDLRAAGLPEPPHPNMWGMALQCAARRGVIEYVDHVRSPRRQRAGGAVARWRGTQAAHPERLF
ncbi:hypothetical protein [Kocuria sp.]|uniref:hypothetical protein n=1 Tax=Kocuria sp. TaxID=1871328 RepID=UPI0026DBF3C7|nr:hypothetical protein [Kocuria sp.]MDO4919901.1 hypothetical protein [Kocuria sp.]